MVEQVSLVSEEDFSRLLSVQLGDSWERAREVFRNCGMNLSYDVTNVLMHAVEQQKVDEVLTVLEEHYAHHLRYHHPEIRGTVEVAGINPTNVLLLHICTDVLGLEPRS